MTELKHVFIPATEGEPSESYDAFVCPACGITNQVFDYAGESALPCECGFVVMINEPLVSELAA